MGQNLLLLLSATLLSIGLGEGLLRLVYEDLPIESWARAGFCKDADDLRIMRPNASVTQLGEWGGVRLVANDRGYRDGAWEEKLDSFRVLVLGDSFGFGWGVPEDSTIVSRIGALEGVDAFNLSIPGDGPVRMYHRYLRHVNAIDPALVVVLNYTNDFFDTEGQAARLTEIRRRPPTPAEGPERCREEYARSARDQLDRLYLYRLANRIRAQGGISFSSEERGRAALREGFADDAGLFADSTAVGRAMALYGEILGEIAAERRVLVVSIPSAYRIDPAWKQRIRDVYPGLAEADLDVVDRGLDAVTRDAGIPFLPLRESLARVAAAGPSPYFTGDGHLNPVGQTAAGEVVAARVREIAREPAPPAALESGKESAEHVEAG